jgi:hypothetical protein
MSYLGFVRVCIQIFKKGLNILTNANFRIFFYFSTNYEFWNYLPFGAVPSSIERIVVNLRQ